MSPQGRRASSGVGRRKGGKGASPARRARSVDSYESLGRAGAVDEIHKINQSIDALKSSLIHDDDYSHPGGPPPQVSEHLMEHLATVVIPVAN